MLANTYPDFVSEPETAFTVALNDVYQYQLPELVDPEGNDEPQVYINYMDEQRDRYPDFLFYNNETRTITFTPFNTRYHSGRTFFFTIVVKEKNSDSVKYHYYATVRVEGQIYEEQEKEEEKESDENEYDHKKEEEDEEGQGEREGEGEDEGEGEGEKKSDDEIVDDDEFKSMLDDLADWLFRDGAAQTSLAMASTACLLATAF